MRIVFFTKGDRTLPSSRTRVYLVADYLRAHGYQAEAHQITSRPWWNISRSRFAELRRNFTIIRSLGRSDVLYLHKATDQIDFMVTVLLFRVIRKRAYVFDFDDAIFLPSRRRAAKAWLMVTYAAQVIVGSHFLAEYAQRYNRNVIVISAPIDTDTIYRPISKPDTGKLVRIGWTGTPGHYENMKLLLAPLERLVREGCTIEFMQLGGGEKIRALMQSVPGLIVSYTAELPWNDPKAVADRIAEFDIGVMPLQKNEWNRGKDGWKAKEYMGCGVATVLSNWGENLYIVEDGVSGVLADSEDDWYQALHRLVVDVPYRVRIASGGRARVQSMFSNEATIHRMLEFVGVTRAIGGKV